MYAEVGCELNEHRHGYRSIHYHLLIKPGRQELVAEVQVRTLFEEAWSEIDHYVRYKSNRDSEQADPYLVILNNITSNADTLASFINEMGAQSAAGDSPEKQVYVRELYNIARKGQATGG